MAFKKIPLSVTHFTGNGKKATTPINLDLRGYNPLMAHLLAQSFVYPVSNGLTQTDRG